MLNFLPLGDIKVRCEKIGVTLKDLALDAGLHAGTPYRLLKSGGNMQTDTAIGLTEALLKRERALFEHLAGLHPEWLVAGGPHQSAPPTASPGTGEAGARGGVEMAEAAE